ncbi:MAG: hypothetical protein VXZ96_13540 [Myxococcota bacterium]|nr:hypothetical protein [Myxococcota bacterium]
MDLRSGEMNIAKDTCMLHRGILASKVELILTNERLVIRPMGKLDRMAGATEINIDVDSIDMLDVRGIEPMLYIEFKGEFIKLSGSGAIRMKEPINAQRRRFSDGSSNMPIKRVEPILLQGDIQIFILRHLSSTGEVILTAKSIRIESKGFIENLIFKPVKIEEPIENIQDFEFQRIDRVLKINFEKGSSIALSGDMANRLHNQLVALRDGKTDSMNSILSGLDVVLYQGVLAPAQAGHLILNNERLFFTPTGQLDTIVGAQNFSILLADIVRLEVRGWPDRRLYLYKQSGVSISFEIENPGAQLQELQQYILAKKPTHAFMDSRTELDINGAIRFCEPYGIDAQEEFPIFIERSYEAFNKLSARFGWLLLTNQNVYFLPDEDAEPWQASITNIGQIRQRKSDVPHFALSVKANRHHFYFEDSNEETIQFIWEKITEIKPPNFLVAERPSQPLERLLGQFDVLLFLKDGQLLFNAKNVDIKIIETSEYQKVRIFMSKIREHSLIQGMPLDIELAKDGGRYKMSTILTEIFLDTPDPMGRYYVSSEVPDDIIFYNQRGNFRIDLFRELTYSVFHVIQFDQNQTNGLILEDIWTNIGQGFAQLQDISMGGCSIVLPYNFKTHAPPKLVPKGPQEESPEGITDITNFEELFDPEKKAAVEIEEMRIKLNIQLSKTEHELKMRIVHIHSMLQKNGDIKWQYGLEFVDLDRRTVNSLNQEILQLEREFLRRRKKKEGTKAIE